MPAEPDPRSPAQGPTPRAVGAGIVGAVALNALTWVMLVYAAFHLHVDRTNRRPVITRIGPTAAWGTQLGPIILEHGSP